jgi:hypothetical protein
VQDGPAAGSGALHGRRVAHVAARRLVAVGEQSRARRAPEKQAQRDAPSGQGAHDTLTEKARAARHENGSRHGVLVLDRL